MRGPDPDGHRPGDRRVNDLIRFDTDTPGTIQSTTPITNLAGGDTIVGLDFRPATGQLYGLGSGSRLYTIDPNTAVATQVGAGRGFTLSGSRFGFDFNPVRRPDPDHQRHRPGPPAQPQHRRPGRHRRDAGLRRRRRQDGADPDVVASAYTNSFGGSPSTTLYDIDSTSTSWSSRTRPTPGP